MSNADFVPRPNDLHKWFVNSPGGDNHEPNPERFMQIGKGRFLHVLHQEHPVVGLGLAVSSKNFCAYNSFEAWLKLNLEPDLVQCFHRHDPTRQRLDTDDTLAATINIDNAFAWDRLDAAEWIASLWRAELITKRLGSVLMIGMGYDLKGETDAN
jgi:hypothetical protein